MQVLQPRSGPVSSHLQSRYPAWLIAALREYNRNSFQTRIAPYSFTMAAYNNNMPPLELSSTPSFFRHLLVCPSLTLSPLVTHLPNG